MFDKKETVVKHFRFITLLEVLAISLILLNAVHANESLMPFPQAEKLKYAGIKPNCSQKKLNTAVTEFYEHWKRKYLVESTEVPGDYKVAFNRRNWTVSEAMGYGMLITVQMAGYESKAKGYFDGLNRFRKRYPSKYNKAFMNWRVKNEASAKPDDSATDGDLDMATALLMAAQQWGDRTYFEEAKTIIKNMGTDLVRKDDSLRLGDWDGEGDEQTEGRCYDILGQLQRDYSPNAGLVPDFAVRDSKGKWKPAHPKFLEGENDGDYSYNSCRVPWRIGLSALYYDDARAKKIMEPLMKWVIEKHPNPESFKAGYSLRGKALVKFDEPVFISPIAIAAMSTGHQKWLDAAFDYIREYKTDYFSDSINMLCLLVMSGNYWLPEYRTTIEHDAALDANRPRR